MIIQIILVIVVLVGGIFAAKQLSKNKKNSDNTPCTPSTSKEVTNAKDYIYLSNKCVANTCVDGYILDTTENTCTLDCKNIITDLSNDAHKKECYPECYTSDGSLLADEDIPKENKVKCGIETSECYGKTLDNVGSIESAKTCGLISEDKDSKCFRLEGDKVVSKTLQQLITVGDTETAKLCYPSVSDKIGNNCYKPGGNNDFVLKTAEDFPASASGLQAAFSCNVKRGEKYCYDETKKGFPNKPVGNFLYNLDWMDKCHPGESRKVIKPKKCYKWDSSRIELKQLSDFPNVDTNPWDAFECGLVQGGTRCYNVVNGKFVQKGDYEFANRKDAVDCDFWRGDPYECYNTTKPYGKIHKMVLWKDGKKDSVRTCYGQATYNLLQEWENEGDFDSMYNYYKNQGKY